MTRFTLLIALVAARAFAGEKPNPYLAQARVFYQGFEFKKCLDRLKQAERWESSPRERAEVALYAGLCQFYVKKPKEAEGSFRLALLLDPVIELPPLTSPKIKTLWDGVKASMPPPPVAQPKEPTPPEVAPEPAPKLAKDAPVEEAPARLTPSEAKPVAEVAEPRRAPTAGIVVTGVAVAAGALGVGLGVAATSANVEVREAQTQLGAVEARQRAETLATGANVSYAVAGAAAITAVILFIVQR